MNKLLIPKSSLFKKFIFVILIGMGVIFLVLALNTKDIKKQVLSNKKQETITKTTETTTQQTSQPVVTKTLARVYSTPIPTKQPIHTTTPTSQPAIPTSLPTSNQVATNNVILMINGDSAFTVAVNQGSNQCDVLNAALSQGKISSLNMRYDNTYQTYAIYQINGIGKDNSVWWVYTVNGTSATQGCSNVKVNNGDNVEWKYIGS